MKYLNIVPGVSSFSDSGRIFSYDALNTNKNILDQVLKRDDSTCQYCGFKSERHQTAHYIGQNTKSRAEMNNPDNFVTACYYCQQCFYIDQVAVMQSGAIIWLPEIGQAALNHICRAVYIARITQGPIADAARNTLDILLSRREEAKSRIGTDDAMQLATVLQDFMEQKEYKARMNRLKHIRILPLDRRVIREGEMEFNQFPQILAYWRSKDGPFGPIPPRTWAETFQNIKNSAA